MSIYIILSRGARRIGVMLDTVPHAHFVFFISPLWDGFIVLRFLVVSIKLVG